MYPNKVLEQVHSLWRILCIALSMLQLCATLYSVLQYTMCSTAQCCSATLWRQVMSQI